MEDRLREEMMKRLLLIALLFLANSTWAAEPAKDLVTDAREEQGEMVKKKCVDFWTTDSNSRILAKYSSVAEICGCIQDEMKFTVSDNLSIRLYQAPNGYIDGSLSREAFEMILDEWNNRYSAASLSCFQRFIRRRNQR